MKHNWGDLPCLKNVLDKLWSADLADSSTDYSDLSRLVNQQIPDVDLFDNLEATFAQDFCICVDAALLAYSNNRTEALIEYFFEPFRMSACYKRYGVLDVGSELESEFEKYLSESELLKTAISQLSGAIDSIQEREHIDENFLRSLRRSAVESSWSVEKLLE